MSSKSPGLTTTEQDCHDNGLKEVKLSGHDTDLITVLLQATFLASIAQDLPSTRLLTVPALSSDSQPSGNKALPLKAPAAPMNTQSAALKTNGQPSMAVPSKAAATDLPAAAGLGLSQVSSVDQPHKGNKSPGEAPSMFSHPTRSLSRLPRRVREAARAEPISTEKAESTAGKAEPLAAKRRQPISPMARPSNSRPSVSAATAGILNADSPADLNHSSSPIKGVVKTGRSEPTGPEIFEELLAKLPPLRPMTPSDEVFAKGTIAVSPDGFDDFAFLNHTAAVTPPTPQYGMDAMTDAVLKGFPKQPTFSQPLYSDFLQLSFSSLLSEAEIASEVHSVQPNAMPAAASMPGLPSLDEAEVAPTPSSKKSGKPPRHPRIKALMGGRGKGPPLLPPAVTPIKSPAPVPTGSSVGVVLGPPTTPGPVLGSPSIHAEVDPSEQPTPDTPVGSPMNWSPTPLVADAAPFGTSTKAEAAPFGNPSKALNPHTDAVQTPSPIVSEPSPVKSPLKSLTKAFALPKKAPGKTSTKGKGVAGSPPAKAASKLLSPIKFIFGSSTTAAKVDAASDQLPLASSPALEASGPDAVPAHSVDSGAAVAAASSSAQSVKDAPTSLQRVPSLAGDPPADSASHVDVTSPTNRMPSFLGTGRIPIRKPDPSADEDSMAVLTKLASSRTIRSSSSALPRAQHRAGVTQPVIAAAEKGHSRNPFAKFGLQSKKTAPEGAAAKSFSLLNSTSILKRLASKGKENAVAASSSHLKVAPVSAHQQPLATSNKLGGVTGADSSLLTSTLVSEQSRDSGYQNVNTPGLKAQIVSVLSSTRSSPVQPQLFASNSAVAVAAVNSINQGGPAVEVRQDISDGSSGMGSTPSPSPKMGPALSPQQAASTMSRAGPSAAVDSIPHQGVNLSFSSSPKLSPVVLPPPKATSLTPLGVAATPGTVIANAQPVEPDQAMLHAPQKPQAISTPVFEGTRLFKLGKLDRGRARLAKKAGQERTKVPPAPSHQSIRQVVPQTPSVDGGFNSLLMGGRQLAFEEPAAVAPGALLNLVIPVICSCRQLTCLLCMFGSQQHALTLWMSLCLCCPLCLRLPCVQPEESIANLVV